MIRHLDAAYDNLENKKLLGFFILEEKDERLTGNWEKEILDYNNPSVFSGSLKHREQKVIEDIQNAYIGHVTWAKLGKEFDYKFID